MVLVAGAVLVAEVAFWSVAVVVLGAAELVAGAVLVAEVAFWSGAAVPLAVVEPAPTVLEEVWLLTGGLVVAVWPVVAVLPLGAAEELAADWSDVELEVAELGELEVAELGGVFMLVDEPLLAADALVVSAEVPLAEAELLPHESEIMLMEVTLREPPPLLSLPERDPWTST